MKRVLWNDDPEATAWWFTWSVGSGVSYHVSADLYGPKWQGNDYENALLSSTGSGCQLL